MQPFRESEYEWVLTDVSLIAEDDTLNPENVTEILAIQPTATRAPGADPWLPGPLKGRWVWRVDEHSTRDFSAQLNEILGVLEDKRGELQTLIKEGIDVYLRVHGFAGNNSSITLSSEQLQQISLARIPVRFSPNTNAR